MSTTNLLLLAGVLLFIGCYAYVYFGTKSFVRRRNARLDAEKAGKEGSPQAVEASPQAVGAAPPVVAAPATPSPAATDAAAASPFLSAPDGPADDLLRIKGIGPKLSARLAELGVFHYRQIAGWTPAELAAVDAQLGNFQGRPERDQWQSQARLLAAGDMKAYERVHGKLGPADPPATGG
jgi:predicted flap endonuclease-1-like 5' DNA nuclease